MLLAFTMTSGYAMQQPTVQLFPGTANVPAGGNASSLLAWPPAPPYSHTVKELGASASAVECQAKCVAYRNADASPVSGWTTCKSFTWLPAAGHGGGGRCVGVVDGAEWSPTPVDGAVAGLLAWPPAPCASDADCSYNGKCEHQHNDHDNNSNNSNNSNNGNSNSGAGGGGRRGATAAAAAATAAAAAAKICRCDAAWKGDRCQTLALLPTARDAGLRLVDGGSNTSSWGGSVVRDPATGLLHMWSSELLAHCGIDSWTTNSHVIHAASADGGRTFARRASKPSANGGSSSSSSSSSADPAEVWPAFSHEPNVVRAPTGEWVMYWTALAPAAAPQPVCEQCADGRTPAQVQCAHSAAGSGPTYMSVAASPDGPWGAPQRLFAGAQSALTNMDTNLAVVILANGSAVGIGRTGGGATGIVAHLVTAADWRNPAAYVGRWTTMLFPNTTVLPSAGVEDPSVYVDAAGVFHAVFHNQIEADDERLCGGHAYSVGGEEWVFTGTSWSNEVRFVEPAAAAESSAASTGDASAPPAAAAYNYTYRFSRMERPHLVFGDPDRPFQITGLTAGVQYGAAAPLSVPGQDACFTLFQPVQTQA